MKYGRQQTSLSDAWSAAMHVKTGQELEDQILELIEEGVTTLTPICIRTGYSRRADWRKVETALQNLRKRDVIYYDRYTKKPGWRIR